MLLKRLADVSVADVDALRENGVPESHFLDYKAEGVGGREDDKREFLADVSAFANASGGDIVFGIRERAGVPEEVAGYELDDPEAEKLRLGSLIRTGLEPRLSTADMRWIPISGKRGVMVVRVPRSWAAPHRVTLRGHNQFYMRNSDGKHPMNVDDLRQAFGLAETVANRIRGFRDERIAAIVADELPFTLLPGPKVVVHVVPLSSAVDPADLKLREGVKGTVPPLGGASGYDWQFCLEGIATRPGVEPLRAYSLMFRTGAVECMTASLERQDGDGVRFINLVPFEAAVRDTWKRFKTFAAHHGLEPPVTVFATLLEVGGLGPRSDFFDIERPVVSRKALLKFPEVSVGVDEFGEPPERLFKGLFDVAANAFGLPGSKSYDAHGNYVGPR